MPTGAERGCAGHKRQTTGRPRGPERGLRATGTGREVRHGPGDESISPGGSENPRRLLARGEGNDRESEFCSWRRRRERGGRCRVRGRREALRIHCRQEGRRDLRPAGVVGRQWLGDNKWWGYPCGHRHVIYARCVKNAIRRSGAQTPLFCSARGCTVRYGKREAPEAAVQAGDGPRSTAVGLGEDTRRWRGWTASWALLPLGQKYVGDGRPTR